MHQLFSVEWVNQCQPDTVPVVGSICLPEHMVQYFTLVLFPYF